MKVITLLNEKGGVGKTTLATHIAAGLAIRGRRVVLVDADPQASSTSQMGLQEQDGFYRLLAKYAEWDDVLRRPAVECWAGKQKVLGELYVLPGNIETRAIPMVISDAALLAERVADLGDWADVMVIDTSPTPSLLHSMIYMATDYIIYPSKVEMLSLQGLGKSLGRLTDELQKNRRLYAGKVDDAILMGIVPMMFDGRTNAHDYGMSVIEKKFTKLCWAPVAMRTVWRDASFSRKLLFAHAPAHEGTLDAWGLVDRVEGGLVS